MVAVAVIGGGIAKVKRSHRDQVTGQTIKIGSILPLSGDFAIFGEPISQGAQLAVKEAQEKGIDVQYISEDDRSTLAGSTNAANKLVRVDGVQGVMTAMVQEVKPASPVFAGTQVPLLATWDSTDYIKTQAGPNVFTIGFSTEGAGQKMAMYAYNELHLRKVATLSIKDEWSDLISSAFRDKFKALGGEISVSESLPPTQRDFRTSLAKIKNSNSDGVFFPFPVTGMDTLLIQAKQLGLNIAMMTADGFSPDQIAGAKEAAEGVYFASIYGDNTKALAEKYKTKFGKDVTDPTFFSFGYDGVNTLIAAAQISRSKNVSMVEAMKMVSISGVDRQIKFSSKNYAEKFERIYKIVDGKPTEVKN